MKNWRTPKLQILDMAEVAKTISVNARSGGGGCACGGWCVSYGCYISWL